MTNVQQQVQWKPESTASDARSEFERGLEELMCGHLDDCLSFTSCSSARNAEDEDDEADRLVRRRRRGSELEGDDLAESSAARRCHSLIFSRWAARHAQEMITTIERTNRESELMALAGLNTVSTLNSSFPRESQSQRSRGQGNTERPSTQASSILQMWRELEDEHMLNRARGRVRERLSQRRSLESNANISSINMLENHGSDNQGSFEDVSESENDYAAWSHDAILPNPNRELDNSSHEQSTDLGEVERERVRQIARGWMESDITDHSSNVTRRSGCPTEAWLGETERERVRNVREWVQTASQQRGARGHQIEEHNTGHGAQVDRIREGAPADLEEGQPEHIPRDLLRVHGRQARIDLLVRIERERQRELQSLLEHRAVSDFAHRNRIQLLLRGRFLRNERPVENERPPSLAANELVQLRRRHTVSGLREGFRSRLENIVRGQASTNPETSTDNNGDDSRNGQDSTNSSEDIEQQNSEQLQSRNQESISAHISGNIFNVDINTAVQNTDLQASEDHERGQQEQGIAVERVTQQESTSNSSNDRINATPQDAHRNWLENSATSWPMEAARNDGGDAVEEAHQVWHEDGLENWSEGPSDPPRMRRSVPNRRPNRFHPPDDDNVYSMELRELLSRRSVSNLLSSGFRESLDQLIRSYVDRQDRAPIDWDLHRMPIPVSPERDQDQPNGDQNEGQHDGIGRPSLVLPNPPVPPPQPLWHQDLHHSNWHRPNVHRSEFEWEILSDVRADMTRLQQGMNHMQRMLEACMDMQLELQRSIRQEVSSALNRSIGGQGIAESSEDGSKSCHVRKGVCCICCDNQIDSLLYRCGHMCTCLKCANELFKGGDMCPLCRAPIVEVIRAYSIL